jgi:hypothetical protein
MREDATGQMGSRLERSESHVTALTPDSAYLCPMLCEGGESNEPDQHCPVCGVLLLRREDVLGTAATASVTDSRLAPEGAPEGSVLAIPDLAVLRTGEREIVYVQEEPGVYARREIITGPAGIAVIDGERSRYVPVLAGLEPGMRVVTRGNFLLDSQSALTGAASAAYGSALDTEDAAPMPSGHQH